MPSLLCIKYKLPVIIEKKAIVMIIWNLFFALSLFTCSKYNLYTYSVIIIMVASLSVSYPLIGWLADIRFGRFKVLRAGSYPLAAAIILKSIGKFIIRTHYLFYLSLIVWSVAVAGWLSSIIPFVTDQVVGASAEELSFVVVWLLLSTATGYCVGILTHFLNVELCLYAQFCLSLISFVVALIWLEYQEVR